MKIIGGHCVHTFIEELTYLIVQVLRQIHIIPIT